MGTGSSYTVPAGFVAVVAHLSYYASTGAAPKTAFFQDDVSGAAFDSAYWDVSTNEAFQREGRWVFTAGQAFHFQVDTLAADGVDVYAGGYLLGT